METVYTTFFVFVIEYVIKHVEAKCPTNYADTSPSNIFIPIAFLKIVVQIKKNPQDYKIDYLFILKIPFIHPKFFKYISSPTLSELISSTRNKTKCNIYMFKKSSYAYCYTLKLRKYGVKN